MKVKILVTKRNFLKSWPGFRSPYCFASDVKYRRINAAMSHFINKNAPIATAENMRRLSTVHPTHAVQWGLSLLLFIVVS